MKEYILCLINNDNGKEVYFIEDEKFTLKKELARKFIEVELEDLKERIEKMNKCFKENVEFKILPLNELNNEQ